MCDLELKVTVNIINTRCISMSEAITMPNFDDDDDDFNSFPRNRLRRTHTQTHRQTHRETDRLGLSMLKFAFNNPKTKDQI